MPSRKLIFLTTASIFCYLNLTTLAEENVTSSPIKFSNYRKYFTVTNTSFYDKPIDLRIRSAQRQALYLNDTTIETIQSGAFFPFTGVQDLYFQNNSIRALTEELFSSVNKHELLELSYNYINEIEPDAFKGLDNLIFLYLDHNELEELKIGVFRYLKSLKVLELSYNYIKTLDYGVFNGLEKLYGLDLGYNELKSAEEDVFHNLHGLRILNLTNNYLTFVSVIKLKRHSDNLQEIDLNGNNFTCQKLSMIISYKIVTITSGKFYNVSNINGIPCTNPSAQNRSMTFNGNYLLRDIGEFMRIDFKNTSFYKTFSEATMKLNALEASNKNYSEIRNLTEKFYQNVSTVRRNNLILGLFTLLCLFSLIGISVYMAIYMKKMLKLIGFSTSRGSEMHLI